MKQEDFRNTKWDVREWSDDDIDETDTSGSKYDQDKPPMELLPPNGLIEVSKAMGYGAIKYNERYDNPNWPKTKGAKRRYLGAALRHIMAIMGGELRDKESGQLHAAHAAFCLLVLCEFHGEYRVEQKED